MILDRIFIVFIAALIVFGIVNANLPAKDKTTQEDAEEKNEE